MQVLVFIKAVMAERHGNILDYLIRIILVKSYCIQLTTILPGWQLLVIYILLIKKEVFIKLQMVVKHGSKLYTLMIPQVQLKWTSIHKIQMSCTLLCGIKQGVPGILKKGERQAAYIKAMMAEIHGNR